MAILTIIAISRDAGGATFCWIITSKTDIDWSKFVQIAETGETTTHAEPIYASKFFCLHKFRSDFLTKSQRPYKSLNRYQNQDVVMSKKCEEILTRIYWNYFMEKWIDSFNCTLCTDCTNFINCAMLNFWDTKKLTVSWKLLQWIIIKIHHYHYDYLCINALFEQLAWLNSISNDLWVGINFHMHKSA